MIIILIEIYRERECDRDGNEKRMKKTRDKIERETQNRKIIDERKTRLKLFVSQQDFTLIFLLIN